MVRPGNNATGLVDVAAFAIADVELVADDRPIHRVSAVSQLAVENGVIAEVFGEVSRATRVPARAMAVFGIHESDSKRRMGLRGV